MCLRQTMGEYCQQPLPTDGYSQLQNFGKKVRWITLSCQLNGTVPVASTVYFMCSFIIMSLAHFITYTSKE